MEVMFQMEFYEVIKKSRDVKSFIENARKYLDQRGLTGEERKKHYWALHYKWKERIFEA